MERRSSGSRAQAAALAADRGLAPFRLGVAWQAIGSAFDLRSGVRAEVDARRLFLWLPVAMGLGVLLFLAADGVPSPWPALAAGGGCLAIAWRCRARLALQIGLTGLAFVLLGFGAMALRTATVAAPALDRPVLAKLSAFVETVDAGPAGGRMVLVVTSFSAPFAVVQPRRLRATFKGAGPRAGDHILGQARLMPPPQPAFPGGYDFSRDAYFLGLGAVGRWIGPMTPTPAAGHPGSALAAKAAIDNARTDLTIRIAAAIGGQAGALSAALVTGKRGLLETQANDDLRASGLYHIVSISGLHMVLAAGVFFWLARAVLALLPGVAERRPIKKWAAGVAMLGASAYCIFSGSEVATERSLIMTLTLLGAVLFDRPALSMRNLAIAALVVLAREPETIAGPSFQMSFAAVAAMIAAHEVWSARRRRWADPSGWGGIWARRVLLAVGGSIATTLIASFATAPFAAFHFQRVNPYGLIGNALAIPFVSLIVMPAAVGGTLLMPLGLDGPVWQLMGLGSAKVLDVARYVAAIDGSVRGIRAFPVGALLWMGGGFVVLVLVRTPLRLVGLMTIMAAGFVAARAPQAELFVDRQALVVALRGEDGRLRILGRSASRFVVDRWLGADGDLRKGDDPSLKDGIFCDRSGCVGRLGHGEAVALVLQPAAFEEDCRRAALVVTPLQAPPFCRSTADVIDRQDLKQAVSLAIYRSAEGLRRVEARPADNWKPWFGRDRGAAPPAEPSAEPTTPGADLPPDDGADVILP